MNVRKKLPLISVGPTLEVAVFVEAVVEEGAEVNDLVFNQLFISLDLLQQGERPMPEAEDLAILGVMVVLHVISTFASTFNMETGCTSFIRTLYANSATFLLANDAVEFVA